MHPFVSSYRVLLFLKDNLGREIAVPVGNCHFSFTNTIHVQLSVVEFYKTFGDFFGID